MGLSLFRWLCPAMVKAACLPCKGLNAGHTSEMRRMQRSACGCSRRHTAPANGRGTATRRGGSPREITPAEAKGPAKRHRSRRHGFGPSNHGDSSRDPLDGFVAPLRRWSHRAALCRTGPILRGYGALGSWRVLSNTASSFPRSPNVPCPTASSPSSRSCS